MGWTIPGFWDKPHPLNEYDKMKIQTKNEVRYYPYESRVQIKLYY